MLPVCFNKLTYLLNITAISDNSAKNNYCTVYRSGHRQKDSALLRAIPRQNIH